MVYFEPTSISNGSSISYRIWSVPVDYGIKDTSLFKPALQLNIDAAIIKTLSGSNDTHMDANIKWMQPLGEKYIGSEEETLPRQIVLSVFVLVILLPFAFMPVLNLSISMIAQGIPIFIA